MISDSSPPIATSSRVPGDRSRLALAAFVGGAGITHFVVPSFYEKIVPQWIGHEQAVARWSGVAELLCAGLLVVPRTKRFGAWLTFVLLIVVYPANVQMAIDAGVPRDAESAAIWARLPVQIPLWIWSFRVARRS